MDVEKKAQNHKEITRELLPFILYAAIPLTITISIALIFGVK